MTILKTAGKLLLALVLIALLVLTVALLFLFLYPSVGQVPDKAERDSLRGSSDHCADRQFHNEDGVGTLTGEKSYASDRKIPQKKIAAETPSFLSDAQAGDLSFTWFGHSSFLLQMGRSNILVDPVLSERCSPVGFAGPKRFSELPLTAEELPRIDVLFLSHDHYDHLDYRTILAIGDRAAAVIAPLGMDAVLRSEGIPRCSCGGVIRPGIVLYGEPLEPFVLIGARREIASADTMIVAGTSLAVEPAASLLEGFSGKDLVVINNEPTPADTRATLVIRGDVSEVFEKLMNGSP